MTGDDRQHVDEERSVAIDLSRRKTLPPRAAAPYVSAARIAIGRLKKSRLARAGVVVLGGVAAAAIVGGFLAADAGDASQALLPPLSGGHVCGTDAFGRDLLARVARGAGTALSVGLAASTAVVVIGVLLGALAGFAGGAIDSLVTRAVESLTAIPTLVLVLVVGALVAHPTTATLVWTIALTRWTELARVVRAEVLRALSGDYVTAARALGASPARVLWRHVLPSAVAPAIVAAAFSIGTVIVVEAAVDFLRVGSPDAMVSWGETMGEARAHASAWWLVAFPAAALVMTLGALNAVGEAVRDAFDPRMHG